MGQPQQRDGLSSDERPSAGNRAVIFPGTGGQIVADGAVGEVLNKEQISAHYGAAIEVIAVGDGVAVVPVREPRPERDAR